jgi:hypothetical protein
VNGQTVVCFVNTAESCNNRNVLFSLKPENASRSGDVIAKLLRFSQRGGGGPVLKAEAETGKYVKLEDVVNKAFESGAVQKILLMSPNPVFQILIIPPNLSRLIVFS